MSKTFQLPRLTKRHNDASRNANFVTNKEYNVLCDELEVFSTNVNSIVTIIDSDIKRLDKIEEDIQILQKSLDKLILDKQVNINKNKI